MNYEVLLYYLFTDVADPQAAVLEHQDKCQALDLKGRIFIAEEGINGTVSGLKEHTQAYIDWMNAHPLFAKVTFKREDSDGHAFKKMHVRVKDEIVRLQLPSAPKAKEHTAPMLKPREFHALMHQDDVVIIDNRNAYEYDLGHFKGAIKVDVENFRDFPAWFDAHKESFKDKTVLTYCTGGIRCEKVSGWMIDQGVKDVYQLEGGIITYGQDEAVLGADWEGQCYVFDNRIATAINRVNPSVVGQDYFDGTPCERYINCANPECNKKILCSFENEFKYHGSCTDVCRDHPHNRHHQRLQERSEHFENPSWHHQT